jgi:hypothetical protein
MMYTCECCNFTTPLKGNYSDHLLTKKHERNLKASETKKAEAKKVEYRCKHCTKVYKHSQSLNKHKKICTENEDSDINSYDNLYKYKYLLSQIDSEILKQKFILSIPNKIERLEAFDESAALLVQLSKNKDIFWMELHRPNP